MNKLIKVSLHSVILLTSIFATANAGTLYVNFTNGATNITEQLYIYPNGSWSAGAYGGSWEGTEQHVVLHVTISPQAVCSSYKPHLTFEGGVTNPQLGIYSGTAYCGSGVFSGGIPQSVGTWVYQ